MASRAISGTRRSIRELVDGTVRVQIDIDPECRRDFFRLFPEIDTRIAIAPLKPEAKPTEPEALKGGELAKLAGMLCADMAFQIWIDAEFGEEMPVLAELPTDDDERAATILRHVCRIESRAELDHKPAAAAIFHERIRKPWMQRKAA